MLLALALIFFMTGIQALPEEESSIPSEILADVIQQAEKLQQQANTLINENSPLNLKDRHFEKRCPSLSGDGKSNKSKDCAQNPLNSSEKPEQILAFVSFSMPKISLKSLFQEAPLHHAVLVMRGLEQDSFGKTALKLQKLGITVDINPELFEKHHVESVPTFILIKNGHPTHRLKGNVSLSFAAQKLKDQLKDQSGIQKRKEAS